MKKINRAISDGFTLVELLIVIALIAILSVAVLATINPIEQTNKARDASMKNDAAEVLNAYERYYASQNSYPWNLVGTTVASTWIGAYDSTAPEFGVVNYASGTGALIVTSELKSAFQSKAPFKLTSMVDTDHMYVYHSNAGNNYVCFTPKANANRTGEVGTKLKCLSGTGAAATLVDQGATCIIPNPWTNTVSATAANLMCVPEGSIQ